MQLLGVEAEQWEAIGAVNKLLVTSEGGSMKIMEWNTTKNSVQFTDIIPDPTSPDYPSITQWEHVTFLLSNLKR